MHTRTMITGHSGSTDIDEDCAQWSWLVAHMLYMMVPMYVYVCCIYAVYDGSYVCCMYVVYMYVVYMMVPMYVCMQVLRRED